MEGLLALWVMFLYKGLFLGNYFQTVYDCNECSKCFFIHGPISGLVSEIQPSHLLSWIEGRSNQQRDTDIYNSLASIYHRPDTKHTKIINLNPYSPSLQYEHLDSC